MENKWREIRQTRYARLAPSAPASCNYPELLAPHHRRLLARSTSGGAASGRTGARGLRRLSARPKPAFDRTAVLPNPASLAGDDASAARYTPQRTPASNDSEAFKMI